MTTDTLANALSNIILTKLPSVQDPNIEWSHLYEQFKEIDDKPVVLTEDEFEKYKRVLFNPQYIGKIKQGSAEFDDLRGLSSEFLSKINPYKPFTIVDISGNVISTYPAIFTQINSLNEHPEDKESSVAANNVFDNLGSHQLEGYRHSATVYLMNAIMQCQDHEKLINALKEYGDMTAAFHKGDPTAGTSSVTEKPTTVEISADDLFTIND